MKAQILLLVRLFGECDNGLYTEDFETLEFNFAFTLSRIPSKEKLMESLPQISERDDWQLQLQNESGEDIIVLRHGDDIDDVYNTDYIEPYVEESVRFIYSVNKNKNNDSLTVYDFTLLTEFLGKLTVTQFISLIKRTMQERLVLEVWSEENVRFASNSFAVIKKGDSIPQLEGNANKMSRVTDCKQHCQWNTILANLLPDDVRIISGNKGDALSSFLDQICILLSVCYVADFSSVENNLVIRISGYKTLVSRVESAIIKNLSFDTASVNQWYNIYDWCYVGGYTSERLTIARNIISLNCSNADKLNLNDSTIDAIKSNFKIYEKDNVRQYIKVRNDVSKELLNLQDKVNSIVEGFTGDFRKSVVGLGTFFLTLVVVRVVANGQWTGAFSNEIVCLSFLFILLSVVILVYSRKTLNKKEHLYYKHYNQMKERYAPLLSKEESDKIFEDCNPNKVDSHSNYIDWQKNRYTWIWALTLLVFVLFLFVVWCYNLFETTNNFRLLKAISSCCVKNI